MAKDLVMYFLNTSGRKVSVKVKGVKDDLTAEQVSPVMDAIIEKNVFLTSSGDFAKKDSAHIIDTQITELEIL
jgi:hypothetical protein